MLTAIIFEEQGAYQFRKNKDLERQNRAAGGGGGGGETAEKPVGLEQGFEEDFSFGAEDDNDYWSGTDLID